MRPEARALGNALLQHHKTRTQAAPPAQRVLIRRYTISYSDLCARARVPHLTRIVGSFLGEVAQWCADHGYPPLNALAVNASTAQPGEGYDGAGGFKMVDWHAEVERCIRFTGYPASVT